MDQITSFYNVATQTLAYSKEKSQFPCWLIFQLNLGPLIMLGTSLNVISKDNPFKLWRHEKVRSHINEGFLYMMFITLGANGIAQVGLAHVTLLWWIFFYYLKHSGSACKDVIDYDW
jgi:hypothetical protein